MPIILALPPPPLTLPPLPLPSHNLSLRPPRLAPYPGFLTMHLVSYPDLTRPSQATTKISVTRRIWVGDYLALYLTPSSSRTIYVFTSFRLPPSPLLQSPQLDHLCRVNYNSVLSSNYFVSGSSQPLFSITNISPLPSRYDILMSTCSIFQTG